MKIIYQNILPPRGFSAMQFCGIILARTECKPISERTINHEKIHAAQAYDFKIPVLRWVIYYVVYLYQWAHVGFDYMENPMELEAYDNERNLDYLETRVPFAWKQYIKN